MAKKKQSTPLTAAAISALRQADFDGNRFTLAQDDLACYSEIKALVVTLGGRWVAKTKTHDFPDGIDAESLVLACCDRGEIPPSNKNDYYPTPIEVVARVVEEEDFAGKWAAKIDSAELDGRPLRYLEPSGGSGALVAPMYARMRALDQMVIVEANPLLAAGLRSRYPKATVVEGDFLQFVSEQPFDVVLMNPPFAGKEYQEHVRRAFSMLGRMGLLAAIVPSGYVAHDAFCLWVNTQGEARDLGADKFADTKIATSILWLQNDPQNNWRDQPFDGYSTWHAWNAVAAVSSDSEVLESLAGAESEEARFGILSSWARNLVREGSAQVMTIVIAKEVLPNLADYMPAFARPDDDPDDDRDITPVDSKKLEEDWGKIEQLTMEIDVVLNALVKSA